MNYKSLFILWLSGVSLLAAPGVETIFQRVALADLPAPGVTNNNVRFSFFEDVSLADDGRIAFTGRLSGTGVTSTNNQGLWAGLPGDPRLLLRTGDPVPGDTNSNRFTRFWEPNMDNYQAVGFLADDTSEDEVESKANRAWVRLLNGDAPENVVVGILVTAAFNDLGGHVINVVAGRAELSGPGIGPTNNQAIVAGPPTNVVIVAQTGSPAPGVSGNFTVFPITTDSQDMALTPDGNVAFRATVTDGPAIRSGIWFGKAGSVQAVEIQTHPAPASLLGTGYTFSSAALGLNVAVNARGELAFATDLNGPGLNNTNSSFVVAGPPGGLRVRAQSGQPASGIPGAVFDYFGFVLLGTDGTVAFTARYTTNGTDLVYGLWLAPTNGAPPILLMHAGQRAPGTPADVYFKTSHGDEAYFMNSRNQVVFRSLLTGPGLDQFDKGIWLAEPDGTVQLIVRKGDMVDTGGGVMAQVSSVSFGSDPEFTAGPEDGRRTPFNNRGEIALGIGLEAATPPFTGTGSGLFIVQTGIHLRADRAGNDIRIKFPTLNGKHYRVDYRTNLSAGSWDVLMPSVLGTGAEITVTNTGAALLKDRYYRAVRTD